MSNIFGQLLQQEHDKQKQVVEHLQEVQSSQPEDASADKITIPIESNVAILQTSKQASLQESLLVLVKAVSEGKSTNAATFRFPPEVLDKLAEVEYLLRKDHKVKVTKNALVVGAITYLLWDYEQNVVNSILYRLLIEKP